MKTNPDEKWQSLLARCTPTFAGDTAPPYGFITGTLARLREEKGQQEELERIGWRALLASVGVLLVAGTMTVSMNFRDRGDLDPGERSLVQVENIQVS